MNIKAIFYFRPAMAEENAKTVLVSNAGFLGFLDRGTFR
jgi:hypothetical protein